MQNPTQTRASSEMHRGMISLVSKFSHTSNPPCTCPSFGGTFRESVPGTERKAPRDLQGFPCRINRIFE